MPNVSRGFSPVQILFAVLGIACLVVAFWVAFSYHGPSSTWRLLGSTEGQQTVLFFAAGMSVFFFVLMTVIHLKH